ncbi:MAG: transporter substrate-binding domain-containing protein, partial [Deltaproteobacteria bacterium]|nr:transporter substrate-binding domain-containing protein [Deltaproteobacteria bacterium]
MKKTMIALVIGFTALGSGLSQAKEVKICTDNNRWYPFTWAVDNTALGVHVEVVQQAMKNLGHSATFTPMGWNECLEAAKAGKFDAVVSASYKPERAEFLHYPADAATAGGKSKWRITEVEYVFLSNAKDKYSFEGDVKTLPKPVYGPQGYSVVDDLKKDGVAVETAKGDQVNIEKLMSQGKGIVITISTIAHNYSMDPKYK